MGEGDHDGQDQGDDQEGVEDTVQTAAAGVFTVIVLCVLLTFPPEHGEASLCEEHVGECVGKIR